MTMMTSPRTTLVDALRHTARTVGETHGILYYDTPDSSRHRRYDDLDRNARTVAHALTARGHGLGDMAVIGLSSGLEWADAAWGTLYAGMAFIPAPVAGYGTGAVMGERIAGMARAAEATVFITDAGVLERIDAASLGMEVLLLEELLAEGDADAWSMPALDGTRSPTCSIRRDRPATPRASSPRTPRCSAPQTPRGTCGTAAPARRSSAGRRCTTSWA
ncbi:MAG TPA: hypothetical protein DEA59_06715 [Microbacterium sp.]|nr:hypothetical protein [Microbacterium sp.]|tara:strand:+ start:1674 stop:2330 length:657 start_codon:yes stop_codon:yes gene_type:complete